MLKVSLVALFVLSMATLTIAASSLPLPPEAYAADAVATVALAELVQ